MNLLMLITRRNTPIDSITSLYIYCSPCERNQENIQNILLIVNFVGGCHVAFNTIHIYDTMSDEDLGYL